MSSGYSRQYWYDSTNTWQENQITAERFNHIEEGIESVAVEKFNTDISIISLEGSTMFSVPSGASSSAYVYFDVDSDDNRTYVNAGIESLLLDFYQGMCHLSGWHISESSYGPYVEFRLANYGDTQSYGQITASLVRISATQIIEQQ